MALIVEMEARFYIPALGPFLQVDPVEGGVDNDYGWPTDPIGKNDLRGRRTYPVILTYIERHEEWKISFDPPVRVIGRPRILLPTFGSIIHAISRSIDTPSMRQQ